MLEAWQKYNLRQACFALFDCERFLRVNESYCEHIWNEARKWEAGQQSQMVRTVMKQATQLASYEDYLKHVVKRGNHLGDEVMKVFKV